MKDTVFIYALCEQPGHIPVIRYIGVTKHLTRRLKEHENASIKSETPLGAWLRLLKSRDEAVHMLEMCEVEAALGPETEMLYIRLARDGGMDLVNSTDGGEGITMTPEIRRKIGDAQRGEKREKHPPETCAKISASNTGEKHWNYGNKTPPETRARISESKTGRTINSPETRAKMSGSQKVRRAASNAEKQVSLVKFCPGCQMSKEKADFNRRSVSPDGLQNMCRICSNSANGLRYRRLTISKPAVY